MDRKQDKTKHEIFVYGTLKRGFHNFNHYLTDEEFIEEAKTKPRYRLFDNGHYPCLIEDEKGYTVQGEVFRVSDNTLRNLDRLEGVPSLYRRADIELEDGRTVLGYVYQRDVARFTECANGRWR